MEGQECLFMKTTMSTHVGYVCIHHSFVFVL